MNKLRELRVIRGLSQEELARRCGLSLSGVRQVETGKRMPRIRTAQAIASALGVAVEEIWPMPNRGDTSPTDSS